MKVVFDTNIFLSAFLFKGGVPSCLLNLASDKKLNLFFSPEILEEVRNVLIRKFDLDIQKAHILCKRIESIAQVVYPQKKISLVKKDEPDNRIVECAVEAQADYLITGDKKHLIPLKHPYSFDIVLPGDFYREYYVRKK